jgi:eukaryotic-like serine/threonine-protein kinase
MPGAELTIGQEISHYRVVAKLGAGGMGEVYRARDAKLGRDVALKVLPQAFARDADRMARFQREAKVLASLNHPNIASIYGLEDSGATHALVMELVEGPTLADRIRSGPIPISEVLPIAKQMCEALEYAHERGIVHRDLKPANVKVTVDDAVKVLDFGLAKALEGDASSIDISTSPTLSRIATMQGVLLGTAAYMSPEQAKGKAVDRRADIWAFGCVLYEMLTGKMAFHGESVTDTLAAVIKEEPDWSELPAGTPIGVRALLQRCLRKELRQRLQAIGDARISLEDILSGTPDLVSAALAESSAKARRSWAAAGIAVVLGLAALSFALLYFRGKTPAARTVRFEIPVPATVNALGYLAVSPDGRNLVFVAAGADGHNRLWLRSLEALETRPLDGTEGAFLWPFWSPDSRFIAFFAQGKLKRVAASGGPAVVLCDAPSAQGGSWNEADQIVFGSNDGTQQVAASGGTPRLITTGAGSVVPLFLPDGHHFLYLRDLGPEDSGSGIYIGSIDAKPQEQPSSKLLADYSIAAYAASSDPAIGNLLFVRGGTAAPWSLGTLMAQWFDIRQQKLIGQAVPISEHVSNVGFSASESDVLVYVAGAQTKQEGFVGTIEGRLTWFDREGKALGEFGDAGLYRTFALSPDGKRVAFERADTRNPDTINIWLYDFARGTTTRFTSDSAWDQSPVWSPDGSQIVFASNRGTEFDLYEKPSNLAAEDKLLFRSAEQKAPGDWSPDGKLLLFYSLIPPSHLLALPLGEADRKPIPIERSAFSEAAGRFSPSGRWIAYQSDETGKYEIYVRPFDEPSAKGTTNANRTPAMGKWMVSKDGGVNPLWRRDGKELFYLTSEGGTAMAVEVNTTGTFQAGASKALFKVPAGVLFWDVSSDGKRFLMAVPSGTSASSQPPFTVVLNWQAALKK